MRKTWPVFLRGISKLNNYRNRGSAVNLSLKNGIFTVFLKEVQCEEKHCENPSLCPAGMVGFTRGGRKQSNIRGQIGEK